MSAALELRTAADGMRKIHGPGCPDHAFWLANANLLDEEAAAADRVEVVLGMGAIAERTLRPLRVARAFLATQPAPAEVA
jgi:hypothetical protein